MDRTRSHLVCWMLSLGLLLNSAQAQVAVDVSKHGVKVQSANENSVQLNSASIASDVQIEGVTVINGEVYIDGEQVPKGRTSFTAKRSGKSYRIQWGKNGNVSISEK
jgi:hypothetical protein